MYANNWNSPDNPYLIRARKNQERIRKDFARMLPCYQFFHHPLLTRSTKDSSLFPGDGTLRFQDGRTLTFKRTLTHLSIKRGFISPIKTFAPTPEIIQEGALKWEDLPAQSAHQDLERRAPTEENLQAYMMRDVAGHQHLYTPYYSLYVIWRAGGDISINISAPETAPPADIPTPGFGWLWKGTTLAAVKEWHQTHHPRKMSFWQLIAPFSFLGYPLISLTHSTKDNT